MRLILSVVCFTLITVIVTTLASLARASVPFNIDQTRLSLLVLHGEGQFDEIRVGLSYESVIGGGTRKR